MKRRSTALAVMVLLYAAACNDRGMKSQRSEELVKLDRKMESPVGEKKIPADSINGFMDNEGYDAIVENDFISPANQPLSTFSIDVDDASYSNVRRFLADGILPPPGAVRIEEMINYFDYDYPQPVNDQPFSLITEMSECPWNTNHKLIHIGLQGKTVATDKLPKSNLVFLVDVSGSMNEPDKLPLVQSSLKLLTDQLRENDKVAIVVYAGSAGLVLPSTNGLDKLKIKQAIEQLEAGGSTAGGEGIELAYRIASENFMAGGNNRVILATDGDFNVGISNEDELTGLIEAKRKTGIYLSVLGFGTGNYQDNKMQLIADKGNGNHSYIDNISEAKKVLVKEFGSTLFTIAKDVKTQVEFNPAKVKAYRLIGYENRLLAAADFNDDRKDAGELGSGHTVTALYEIIPGGMNDEFTSSVDELKYQVKSEAVGSRSDEIMTIKLRYKKPGSDVSSVMVRSIKDETNRLSTSSDNYRFSAAVAEFGMLLRNSSYKQKSNFQQVIALAKSAKGKDLNGYRDEFIKMVESTNSLADKRQLTR